jgi:hypothetical protein
MEDFLSLRIWLSPKQHTRIERMDIDRQAEKRSEEQRFDNQIRGKQQEKLANDQHVSYLSKQKVSQFCDG